MIGDDKSDLATNLRLTCRALHPSAENKAAVWKEFTDPASELSLYQRGALMSGFYSNKQIDVIRPYFTKFIEELPELYTKHSFKFVDSFSSHLLPRMEIEDSHIV